ncbi:MAG: hypothetical protein ACYTBJ_21360 [Planctomycetota bacterium]|jgi:hypothetical protein
MRNKVDKRIWFAVSWKRWAILLSVEVICGMVFCSPGFANEVSSVTLWVKMEEDGTAYRTISVCPCDYWVRVEGTAGTGDEELETNPIIIEIWQPGEEDPTKEDGYPPPSPVNTKIGETATYADVYGDFEVDFEIDKATAPSVAFAIGTHQMRAWAMREGTTPENAWECSWACTVHIVGVQSVTVDKTLACINENVTFTANANPSGKALHCIEWQKRYRAKTTDPWGSWAGASGGDNTAVLNTSTLGYYQYRARNGLCDTWKPSPVVAVVGVEVVSVDATDPHNTKVNYTTVPSDATIPSVDFSAPGMTDSKSDVSGSFYFTYDQADVGWGTQTIRLTYLGSGIVDCTVTKTEKMPQESEVLFAYFAGIGTRPYDHKLRETYRSHTYSVTYSGKTIWTCSSIVLMYFGADYDNISLWVERHKYSWDGDESSWVTMSVGSGGGMLPPDTSDRECQTVMWLDRSDLQGIAECTGLIYDDPGGGIPAMPIVNAEVDCGMPP